MRANSGNRDEIYRLVEIFRGRIVDVTDTSFTIELTGSCGKIDAFLKALPNDSIIEVVRSGVLGIARGEKGLKP
jgi:acetolactate synthase-1/3 small subunit